jgi:hypothetical protein
MIGVMWRNTIAAAVLIALVVIGLGAAPAQETWGATGASAGGSRSSSAHGASPVSGAISSGRSSSWTAGKGSFTYAAQPGGIWRDTTFAGSSAPSAGGSAPGTHSSGRSLRLTGLSPAPSAGSATVQGKTQMAHTSGGHRPSAGSRTGIAKSKSGHGGLPGPAGVKSFAAASRSRSGPQSSRMTRYSAGKSSGLSSKAPSTNQAK